MASYGREDDDADRVVFHVEHRQASRHKCVPRETIDRLRLFEALVRAESAQQNLIAKSTVRVIRRRHTFDSLQLAKLIGRGPIMDIGSGAGFPGIVLACIVDDPVFLVEPRSKRVVFLQSVIDTLALSNASVVSGKVEKADLPIMGTITARAVAPLTTLFDIASHLSDGQTRWILPKGRGAADELAVARRTWQGKFALVASRTDPDASIVVAQHVRRI